MTIEPTENRAVRLAERRPIVARLHLRHHSAASILVQLKVAGHNVDVRTVYRDIKALETEWRNALVTDPISARAKELAEYEEAARVCWAGFLLNPCDPVWMTELRGWKKRIAELLGLDAPAKHDVALFVTTLADVSARIAEGLPPGSNQVDMAALRHLEALSPPPGNGASGNGGGEHDD